MCNGSGIKNTNSEDIAKAVKRAECGLCEGKREISGLGRCPLCNESETKNTQITINDEKLAKQIANSEKTGTTSIEDQLTARRKRLAKRNTPGTINDEQIAKQMNKQTEDQLAARRKRLAEQNINDEQIAKQMNEQTDDQLRARRKGLPEPNTPGVQENNTNPNTCGVCGGKGTIIVSAKTEPCPVCRASATKNTSGAIASCGLKEGDQVRVTERFHVVGRIKNVSNARRTELTSEPIEVGWKGIVTNIDSDGDARILFDSPTHTIETPVSKQKFGKLTKIYQDNEPDINTTSDLKKNDQVRVIKRFHIVGINGKTMKLGSEVVEVGWTGVVMEIESDGDARVLFDCGWKGMESSVPRQKFRHLRKIDQEHKLTNLSKIVDDESDDEVETLRKLSRLHDLNKQSTDGASGDVHLTDGASGVEIYVHVPGHLVVKGANIHDCNGVYKREGSYMGKPLYKNGSARIFHKGFWKMNNSDDSDGWFYSSRFSTGNAPPLGQWTPFKTYMSPATVTVKAESSPLPNKNTNANITPIRPDVSTNRGAPSAPPPLNLPSF